MEAYAVALTYATPGFLVLIIIEAIAARIMGRKVNKGLDTISSLSSGMTNTLKSLIGLSIVLLSYGWMVKHLALFEISSGWWVVLLAFIGHDFAGYWGHRFNHEINVFWNRHIVHHSSEEFNLACALRQSISSFVGIYFFLYIPMAIIGIPEKVVMIVAPIHLFAQFWYHTRLIDRMGWLEYIIVTPSHHRVHHAINPIYIDKNYSEIFIIWDKLFGTFQEELVEEPPVYGVKKAVKTWNPVLINFMHIWGIAKDAWRTRNWWDKVRIWFMPTGWRPEDVSKQYPMEVTTDVYAREKYDTNPSRLFLIWAWTQLILTTGLL
ncbi:MAG: sterol desaturase family protein, partial [Bacteroidota bacterium]